MSVDPGIHTMSADTYHADPCERPSLSNTIAKLLITHSPAHAYVAHPRLNDGYAKTEDEKFDIGTCAHSLLLEGEAGVCVVDASDWRTNAAKEARDDARANGQTPLLTKQWDDVQQMVDAARIQVGLVNADPAPFTEGLPEQTLVWEEDGGVVCRARLDWLRDDRRAIDDYKTTSRTANPERWSRTLFDAGYDMQAAFYLRGLKALTGEDADWRFVVQEGFPPYALSVVALAPDALALAAAKVEYALGVWRECMDSGRWPAYPLRVCYAEAPPWAEAQWLEKEEREAA